MSELWDVYDSNRQKTGRLHKRGVPLKKGDYHLVVHVWIYNDEGKILIQKRQPWKKVHPNKWDGSAAGSAIAGDTSKAAAIRETKEELGIDLEINKGKMIHTHRYSRGFSDVWLIKQNININDLKLQYEEVAEAKWATKDEIKDLIRRGEFIDFGYIDKIFNQIKV